MQDTIDLLDGQDTQILLTLHLPGRPTTVTLCLPGETGTPTLPERKGTEQQGQGTHQG
jgi:hypothetical protein